VSKLLFPFPCPSPPAAFVLGAISIDVVYEEVGMKGQLVKYAVQLSVKTVHVYCSFQNDTITVTVSNKCYGNFEYVFVINLE
jgi:hypothetical protein